MLQNGNIESDDKRVVAVVPKRVAQQGVILREA